MYRIAETASVDHVALALLVRETRQASSPTLRSRTERVMVNDSHRPAECAAVLSWDKGRPEAGRSVGLGYTANYGKRKRAAYVYLTATLDAAIWGAELVLGERPGRIYIVEPTGPVEDDPNLTDKKFPGNPTKSYRTRYPLRVMGEVANWKGHSLEQLKAMKDHLAHLERLGIEAIED